MSAPGRRGLPVRTLRARVTVVAGLAITAAVLLGMALLYLLQRESLRANIDGQLQTYAAQIAQAGSAGAWPDPLPPSTLDTNAEAQVLGADGRVLAASRGLAGVGALYLLPAGSAQPVRQRAADGVLPTDVRVIAERTTVRGAPATIVTATSTGLLSLLDTEAAGRLLVGVPITLVLSAAAVWLIVGRALKPVERIRRAVTEITSVDLTRRVPEPTTDDEIRRLANTMNDMLGRLDEAARRQRRFVSDASHELRSPLAAIRTTLEVALAHPDKAPWPTIVARAASRRAGWRTSCSSCSPWRGRTSGSWSRIGSRSTSVSCSTASTAHSRRIGWNSPSTPNSSWSPAAIRVSSSGCSATSSTTPPATPHTAWRSSDVAPTRISSCRSTMTGRGFHWRTGSACSTGSSGWTPAATGRATPPASAWPSPVRSRTRTAARSR